MTTPGEEHEVLAEPPIDALVVPNEGTDAVRGFIPVLGKTRAPVRQGLLVYVARPALLRHCGGKQYTGRQPDEVFDQKIDTIRSRFSTLHDFVIRGRAYFSDEFEIQPEALEKLKQPGVRELLRELGERLAVLEQFTEANIEAELRKLAIERQVKARRKDKPRIPKL